MQSATGIKFDFSIAMGIRQTDGKRKQQLNDLIVKNLENIQTIITGYKIPLLPIPAQREIKDDDD
jgi:hypothetical protein